MIRKKKICVVTGTRAEYGLLKPILNKINQSKNLDLQLVVTGMHLLPDYGNTIEIIKNDGFHIGSVVPLVLGGNTESSMAHSIGHGVIGLAQTFDILNPDIIIILGDRYEALAAAIAGVYGGRIVAHVHGGDKVQGGYDENTRHAITKISHIHFPATEKSAERIMKMGEEPWRIHICGSPSVENAKNEKILPKYELFVKYGIDTAKKIILFILHPISTQPNNASNELIISLDGVIDPVHQVVLIYPNVDPGSSSMIEVIDNYQIKYPDILKCFKNLPISDYLGMMKYADVMVGNSSSGIIESSLFRIPVVNIGSRQHGRERGENIIDVPYISPDIKEAIGIALYNEDFKKKVSNCINPYGEGKTSDIICNTLEEIVIDGRLKNKTITYD